MEFEELGAYVKRRIRDRFTPDMLKRYCAALGWDIDPSTLFSSQREAVMVTHAPKDPWTSKRYTLAPNNSFKPNPLRGSA